MRLLWENRAWNDYLYWQKQDKKTLKRINTLIKDIQRNPFEGIGKPEPLKEIYQVFGVVELTMGIELYILKKKEPYILSHVKVIIKNSL